MDSRVIDAGLQAERTHLAWSRTALAIAASGALLMRDALTDSHLVDYLPGALVVLCGLIFWLCGMARYHRVYAATRDGRSAADPTLPRIAGLLAVPPGVIALVAVLIH